MSLSGRQVTHFTFLDAKASTGIGNVINVRDFRNIVVKVGTAGNANLTVKCQGAVADSTDSYTAPDFTATQSVANNWDYIQMIDLNTPGASVNGDTGFVVTGTDDFRLFEINTNSLDFITFNVTARSAGSVTIVGQLTSNI